MKHSTARCTPYAKKKSHSLRTSSKGGVHAHSVSTAAQVRAAMPARPQSAQPARRRVRVNRRRTGEGVDFGGELLAGQVLEQDRVHKAQALVHQLRGNRSRHVQRVRRDRQTAFRRAKARTSRP